jgi:hypothetical protein
VIDDFSTCDTSICPSGGRSGTWHAVQDTTANQNFQVSVPGGSWNDQTCAAWTTGGGGMYAGFGTQLNGGNPYNLNQYASITISVETSNDIFVQLKSNDGAVFQVNVPGAPGTSMMHTVNFSDMMHVANSGGSANLNLANITDVQIMADVAMGWGYAVHLVALGH